MNPNRSEIKGKIIIVDDDPDICTLLAETLEEEGHQVISVYNASAALEKIELEACDLLITDLEMKGMKGLELIQRVKALRPDTMIIVITAFGTIDSAVQAMKFGAYHYISKPFQLSEISLTTAKALEERSIRHELSRLRKEVESRFSFGNLVGKSRRMQEVFQLIQRVALFSSTVLIGGDSGTGKELIAKAIHYNSPRKDKPFVVINCAAIPENLLESELFGYMRGSFTGAQGDHRGLFEEAQGGSLFLDEIGEMPMSLQVKLLRAIQEREIRRIGSTRNLPIDVRIIAATNRDLPTLVRDGTFREDLYYRLNVIAIRIPPLRERQEDIHLLAHHFLKKYAAATQKEVQDISPEAIRLLLNYDWPGNVRELENVIERAVIMAEHHSLFPSDFPDHFYRAIQRGPRMVDENGEKLVSLEELEREHILRVMENCQGNKQLASQILGIDRSTLYRKLEQYSLTKTIKNNHS